MSKKIDFSKLNKSNRKALGNLLLSPNGMTQQEARQVAGIGNLRARVNELRKSGYQISDARLDNNGPKVYYA